MRVSVCVSYGNVSLSHFVVWGEKAGLIALSWPYLSARRIFSLFCLGFVFIFSFKVVVNIFCRSIGATKATAYLT